MICCDQKKLNVDHVKVPCFQCIGFSGDHCCKSDECNCYLRSCVSDFSLRLVSGSLDLGLRSL